MQRMILLFALTAGLTSALAVCALLLASPAQAAVFVVNSTVDSVDALPGDGVCDDASGACTLRAAVMETNALVGADLINVPAGTYVLTIPGTGEWAAATGDLDVTDDLTLLGSGAETTIIDADGIDRVLSVSDYSASLSVYSLTITGGLASGGGGGGILCWVCDRLSVTNSTISGNIANGPVDDFFLLGGIGGGVALVVALTPAEITSTEISENWAEGGGGGVAVSRGAGVTIRESSVSENWAEGGGGGVAVLGAGGVTIRESSVSENTAGSSGGGVYNKGGTVTLLNSTVSGNVGTGVTSLRLCSGGCYGLGICPCAVGDTSIQNSTVSGNSGGGIANLGGHVTLKNSAIANQASGADCTGDDPLTSGGHNLDSDGTCNLIDPTDLPNTDPVLGPLQDNGGPTLTHALLPGSPAIDTIPLSDCTYDDDGYPWTPEVPLNEDQRGVARPQGGGCDIGAYEVTACADGVNNDGDAFIDAADPGCRDAASVREDPQCQDGIDNEDDGGIDFDGGLSALGYLAADPDPQCVNSFRNKETVCGLGVELALLLPLLIWLRGRRRSGWIREMIWVTGNPDLFSELLDS